MSQIKGKNTKPELTVRKYLYHRGFRYRLHNKNLIGKPDISIKKYKIAIFINGCYWHRHGCKMTTTPKTNTDFWKNKFKENVKRDKNNYKTLKELGWHVIIIWECEVNKSEHLEKMVHALKKDYLMHNFSTTFLTSVKQIITKTTK